MFDPSLCPICGVQYGGNLHNVPPQQGGLDSSYKKAKGQFRFFRIHQSPPLLFVRERCTEKNVPLDKAVKKFPKNRKTYTLYFLVKYITCWRNSIHIVQKSWVGPILSFSKALPSQLSGGKGGGGGGGLELKRLRAFGAFNTNIFHKLG